MELKEYYSKYLKYVAEENNHFWDPFYGKENKLFIDFKNQKPKLSENEIQSLINYLEYESDDSSKKYFVADLLMVYGEFPETLFKPMMKTGIYFRDPSFNRVFFIPCKNSFGEVSVINEVINYIKNGSPFEKVKSVESLYWNSKLYWSFVHDKLNYLDFNSDQQKLVSVILECLFSTFLQTNNIILEYSIAQELPDKKQIKNLPNNLSGLGLTCLKKIQDEKIPNDGKSDEAFNSLWRKINGNEELEKLFYDELNWRNRNDELPLIKTKSKIKKYFKTKRR